MPVFLFLGSRDTHKPLKLCSFVFYQEKSWTRVKSYNGPLLFLSLPFSFINNKRVVLQEQYTDTGLLKGNSPIQVTSVRSNEDMRYQYSERRLETWKTVYTVLCNSNTKNSCNKKDALLLESHLWKKYKLTVKCNLLLHKTSYHLSPIFFFCPKDHVVLKYINFFLPPQKRVTLT